MNIEIANRLAALRKEKGLSQEDLAEKLGISRQAVSKWERAESSPDTDNLIALAKLYNISLDSLLESSPESIENERFAQAHASSENVPGASAREPENECAKFPYPVIATAIYLILGFTGGWWHPGWIVFLTIPIYYWIVQSFGKKRGRE